MQSVSRKVGVFAGLLSLVTLASVTPVWAQTNAVSNANVEADVAPVDGFPDGWQLNFAAPTTAQKSQWTEETTGIDSNHSSDTGAKYGLRVKSTWIDSGGTPSYTGKDPNPTRNPIQNLVVDQSYEFGAWVRGSVGDTIAGTFKGGGTTLSISFYSSTGLIPSTTDYPNPVQVSNNAVASGSKLSFGWTQLKGNAKVPPGTVRAALTMGLTASSQGEVYFDDAFVQINPNAVTFDNGKLKVGGQPFFVNAMFMGGDKCRDADGVVNDPVAGGCPAGYKWDSQRIAEAGYNTILSYPNGGSFTTTGTQNFLNRAKSQGLKVIFSIKDFVVTGPEAATKLAEAEALVETFKGDSSIIGWYICDELGEDAASTILPEFYSMLKRVDAAQDRPVISLITDVTKVSGAPVNPTSYLPSCDILVADPYPVGSKGRGRGHSISLPSVWANSIRSAVNAYNASMPAQSKRGTFMAPQAFAWGEAPYSGPNGNLSKDEVNPTLEEMRTMTYQSLVGGAQGLMFWSYEQLAKEPKWQYGNDKIVDRLAQSTNPDEWALVFNYPTWDTYSDYDGNPPSTNSNHLMKALRTGEQVISPKTGLPVLKTNLGFRMSDMAALAAELTALQGVINGISGDEPISATTPIGKLKARAVTSGGNLYVFITNASNRAFTTATTWSLPAAQAATPARTVSVFQQDTTANVTASLSSNGTTLSVGAVPAWGSFVLKISPR